MTIRNAKPEDGPIIIELIHQMLLETQSDGFPSSILPNKANAALLYERSVGPAVLAGDPVLVAEHEGGIAGFIAGCVRRDGFELGEPAAFGSGLFIYPQFRNTGLTKGFLLEVERQLRRLGVKVWEEAVFCGNIFPQAVLNSIGFTHSMRVYRKALS